MSYCGGADAEEHQGRWRKAGAVSRHGLGTEPLKPGGYGKLNAMASALEEMEDAGTVTDSAALDGLSETLCGEVKLIPALLGAVRRMLRPMTPNKRSSAKGHGASAR